MQDSPKKGQKVKPMEKDGENSLEFVSISSPEEEAKSPSKIPTISVDVLKERISVISNVIVRLIPEKQVITDSFCDSL
jgi:hypothetical protein